MLANVQVSRPQPWNHRSPLLIQCALSKQGQLFLSSVARDPSASNRLICKFIASSSKSIALNALSHLLSPTTTHPHLSSLALPLYSRISEASWFSWNPKLIADLIALLYKQGQLKEAETLVSETLIKLGSRERDLVSFYCNLIDSHSKHSSNQGVFDVISRLSQIVSESSSVYVKERAYKSMISSLCAVGRPLEAENLIEEMRVKGLKPSVFEFRSVVYGYGRVGLFEDMQRILLQMGNEGFELDTVVSNMVLSSYGAYNKQSEMVSWLQRMKNSSIPFSIRTYNSVLNSCPMIMSILQDLKTFPPTIDELMETLKGDEALLVKELIGSMVLAELMEWDCSEGKLDLHGMHLGSAYLIMLQWREELRYRLNAAEYVMPVEITVVCGSGKHSSVRGESPVKRMVREMMTRTRSPMKIDRKNIGCFVAKAKVVKNWLC